jgi:hypothetical protein
MKKTITLISIILPFIILGQDKAFESLSTGSTSADQYVKIPTPSGSDLRLSNPFTIEMWVYIPANTSTQVSLLETEYNNYGSTFLRVASDKRVVLWPNGTNGTNPGYNSFPSTSNLTYGVWNHLAVSYTDVTGTVSIYINGVLDKQGDFTNPIVINNQTSNFYLGANGDSKTVQANVKYDEVRIWDEVRTASQISSNMNSCLTGQENNLIAYYDFENISDTIITDKSNNNFEGAILNSGTNNNVVSSTIDCNAVITNLKAYPGLNLKTYPNPVKNNLFIELQESKITEMNILSLSGKMVQSIARDNIKSIDVSGLQQGVYILKVVTDKGVSTQHFIKQ